MQQNKETIKPKMTHSESGRLGALALNSDPVKKKNAVLKGNETKRRNKLEAKLKAVNQERGMHD